MGLVVAMLGLSCSKANGILVPQPGMKPTSPAFQGEFFTSGSPRNSHGLFKGIFLLFLISNFIALSSVNMVYMTESLYLLRPDLGPSTYLFFVNVLCMFKKNVCFPIQGYRIFVCSLD